MRTIEKVIEKVLSFFTTAGFCAMLIVVAIQIVARFIPDWPASWTEEITRLLFVYTMCLGAPLAMKYKEYVNVDMLPLKLDTRGRNILYATIYLLIAIFCLITTLYAIPFAKQGLIQKSPGLRINMAIPFSSAVIAFLFSTLYSFINLVNCLLVVAGKKEES